MNIAARFTCQYVQEVHDAQGKKASEQVYLHPAYSHDPENPNYKWSQATPTGQCTMTITNPGAFGGLVAGTEYDVLFTPVK